MLHGRFCVSGGADTLERDTMPWHFRGVRMGNGDRYCVELH